jgi:microsomal dipeptidase-like Zn-dependent dipeptidase
VLAIETTDLFNSLFTGPNPPSAAAIDAEVQKYYDKGIRSVQLAHETDNGFSGAALINPMFEVFQFAQNKYGPSCHIDFDCARPRFGMDVYEDADGVCKNTRGLTPEGESLVYSLMARGMLIDVAHLSEKGILQVYQLAKQNVYYPFYHSHTKFRETEPKYGGNNHGVIEHSVPAWVVQRIRRSGGLIGLRVGFLEERTYTPSGVANSCAGSTRSLAQAYAFGRQGLKVPMALGSDLNAFTQTTRPRFRDRGLPGRPRQNPNGACSAGFKAESICQTIAQSSKLGTSFDTLGLADTGSEPDLLTDMKNLGVNIAPLRDKSAETFLLMWRRANNLPQRTGPADLANDIDIHGVEPYVPEGTRKQNYPGACILGLKYCPNSEQLSDPCRFDGECVAPLTCGSGPLCGLPEGHCVCTVAGGCPSTQYCKLRNPLFAFDNECRAKKADGSFCLHKKECLSNHCKFKLKPGPPGPRCVP